MKINNTVSKFFFFEGHIVAFRKDPFLVDETRKDSPIGESPVILVDGREIQPEPDDWDRWEDKAVKKAVHLFPPRSRKEVRNLLYEMIGNDWSLDF